MKLKRLPTTFPDWIDRFSKFKGAQPSPEGRAYARHAWNAALGSAIGELKEMGIHLNSSADEILETIDNLKEQP